MIEVFDGQLLYKVSERSQFCYFCFYPPVFVFMEYSIDHKSPVPLHVQAENLLRTMMADPEYLNGKFLPNEVALAKQLAISRSTLRQALNKLVYEGLLIRKKGIGTKVVEPIISSKSKNWLSFTKR